MQQTANFIAVFRINVKQDFYSELNNHSFQVVSSTSNYHLMLTHKQACLTMMFTTSANSGSELTLFTSVAPLAKESASVCILINKYTVMCVYEEKADK